MQEALGFALGVVQLGTWTMLAAVSIQLLKTAVWTFRAGRVSSSEPPSVPVDPPVITVQIPLRNERARAEESIRSVCELDWPRDRLEVQVLDDSDDQTIHIVDAVAESLCAGGHDVRVIRRPAPDGFKAGALANGLVTARGELVAIFDADARPAADCLRRLWAAIDSGPGLGFVQARWAFVNERSGLLHRVQAVILDALFVGEQARLSTLGRPVQFNGTGGLWRRRVLERAGGWLGGAGAPASVTEDLSLSFRVGLLACFGRTLPDVVVGPELPDTMAAFRRQQARWVRGAGEALRALIRAPAQGGARAGARATMLAHLVRHARQPCLLALTLAWPLTFWVSPRFAVSGVWPALLTLVGCCMGLYFAAVRARLGRSALQGFVLAPVVMALSIGLCPALAASFLGGTFSGRSAEFDRTPKGGGYRARPGGIFELVLGCLYLALSGRAFFLGLPLQGLALAWFFAFGLLWVGTAALGR